MTQQEKFLLSIAGEFGVASELAKLNLNVSVTYGNCKATDIVVWKTDNGINTFKRIEVKTTRKQQFVTGFFQKYWEKNTVHPDYWVFVYIDENNISHYYILTHDEVAKEQMKRNKMSSWQKIKGCDNLLRSQIVGYENQWNKIFD